MEQSPMQLMVNKISQSIARSFIDQGKKDVYIDCLACLDLAILERGFLLTEKPISNLDIKYITCFAIDMDVKDISLMFNIEPASVRTARYRIKKKFGERNLFKFLI